MKNISNLKNLKDLDVSVNQIEIIDCLTELKDLETLDISKNKISDCFQIENLVKCSQLVELQYSGNPVFEDKLLVESDILGFLPNVKFFNHVR